MRSPFTKKTSQTQQVARNSKETIAVVCHRARITRDEWTALLFETGWLWAERNIDNEKARQELTSNVARGFWAWWLCVFIEDDRQLLDARSGLSDGRYEHLKAELIYATSQS